MLWFFKRKERETRQVTRREERESKEKDPPHEKQTFPPRKGAVA